MSLTNIREFETVQYSSLKESITASNLEKKKFKISLKSALFCKVCGEGEAKIHYGILSCLGCKGFFRRSLKRPTQYECMKNNQCKIYKEDRNSCRSCRFEKCLSVGMNLKAVRPDSDFTKKLEVFYLLSSKKQLKINKDLNEKQKDKECESYISRISSIKREQNSQNWLKKLPLEMRTMLMTLLNIETKVFCGDTMKDAKEIYPLKINTIKEIIDDPLKLKGSRTKMRYEPYRMAKNEELSVIVYRRLIAAIDWVEQLAELMNGLSTEDRISLVKSIFAPLMLFKCSAKTATVTEQENLLCLCNFAYVPRNIAKVYSDTYHLDNKLVDRLINELVIPFRKMQLSEEEMVCLGTVIILNPMAKGLSETAVDKIILLRNKVYDTLYQIVKESRPQALASIEFGNLLLFLPIVTSCANLMCENLRFAQTFSSHGNIPLLTNLVGCFPVESFLNEEISIANAASLIMDFDSNNDNINSFEVTFKNSETQADISKDYFLCLKK